LNFLRRTDQSRIQHRTRLNFAVFITCFFDQSFHRDTIDGFQFDACCLHRLINAFNLPVGFLQVRLKGCLEFLARRRPGLLL
jgi:hypothetical protein